MHIALYGAFGWNPPLYAHLPNIIDSNGKKLSKRNPSFLIKHFRDRNILAEALTSYTSLLGFSPTKELSTREDLINDVIMRIIQIFIFIFNCSLALTGLIELIVEWTNPNYSGLIDISLWKESRIAQLKD